MRCEAGYPEPELMHTATSAPGTPAALCIAVCIFKCNLDPMPKSLDVLRAWRICSSDLSNVARSPLEFIDYGMVRFLACCVEATYIMEFLIPPSVGLWRMRN